MTDSLKWCTASSRTPSPPPSLSFFFQNGAGYRWEPFSFGGGEVTLCDDAFGQILGIGSRTLGRHKKRVETGHGIQPWDKRDGTQCTKGISVHVWMESRIEPLEERADRVVSSVERMMAYPSGWDSVLKCWRWWGASGQVILSETQKLQVYHAYREWMLLTNFALEREIPQAITFFRIWKKHYGHVKLSTKGAADSDGTVGDGLKVKGLSSSCDALNGPSMEHQPSHMTCNQGMPTSHSI